MDNKSKLYLLIGGIVAVVLICVLLVGMLDGFWPWQAGSGIGSDYNGIQNSGDKDTTGETGDATLPEGTGDDSATGDTTQDTVGSQGGTESTGTGGGSSNAGGTDIKVDIYVEPTDTTGTGTNTDSSTGTGSNTETGSSEATDPADSTEPSKSGNKTDLNFNDFFG